jgi:hypothetical protein
MTATERIRALLDERGVEWMPSVWSAKDETFYKVGDVGYLATELSSGKMKVCIEGYPTPEQAISATLGAGTCKLTMNGTNGCFGCSECLENIPPLANYCPNCGRKVVDE